MQNPQRPPSRRRPLTTFPSPPLINSHASHHITPQHPRRYASEARRIRNRVVQNTSVSGEAAWRAELEKAQEELSSADRKLSDTEQARLEENVLRTAAEHRIAELQSRLRCGCKALCFSSCPVHLNAA